MTEAASPAARLRAQVAALGEGGRVNAGSLIISIFGDAVAPRGGRLWIGSLIPLLAPWGINERLTRTAVFRLAQQDWLRVEAHGRRSDYLMTDAGQRRFEEASRTIYASQPRPWDGRWRMLLRVGELDLKQREALRRALFWQGFGPIGGECFVHPTADLDEVLHALETDGLGHLLGQLMPFMARGGGDPRCAEHAELVGRAWDLPVLAAAYAEFEARYRPLLAAVQAAATEGLDGETAFVLRTWLVHDWRRLLLRDPELPDILLPPDWPARRVRQLTQALYCALLAPSERYLDGHLQRASGEHLPAAVGLSDRFASTPAPVGP